MAKFDYSAKLLIAVGTIWLMMLPGLGQGAYDDLQLARDALLAKEQRLQHAHETTRADIDRLSAKLETSKQLLDAIDTRLEQTRSAIRKVDDALKGMK